MGASNGARLDRLSFWLPVAASHFYQTNALSVLHWCWLLLLSNPSSESICPLNDDSHFECDCKVDQYSAGFHFQIAFAQLFRIFYLRFAIIVKIEILLLRGFQFIVREFDLAKEALVTNRNGQLNRPISANIELISRAITRRSLAPPENRKAFENKWVKLFRADDACSLTCYLLI